MRVSSGDQSFVGRDLELNELAGGLTDVVGGHGRLFLLTGEPGIGKTRLADELAARAEAAGALVLWGRCWESGGAPAYWPWTQILRSYNRVVASGPETEPLLAALAPLGDIAAGRGLSTASAAPEDFEQARFRLFDSLTTFLYEAARRQPLVLILDDLHAADTPSLLLLRFLARELRAARWLIAGTYRELEASRDAQRGPILADIGREGRVLAMRGLTRSDLDDYMRQVAPSAPQSVADAVYRVSEGNPLFVAELLRLVVQDSSLIANDTDAAAVRLAIPDQLRVAIRRRYDPLGDESQRVLAVAAVIGREFDLAVLEHAVDPPAAVPMLRILDQACAIGLMSPVAGTVGHYSFAHALIRETLYDDLGPARQAQAHRRVAQAIEEVRAADLAPYLAEIAHHYFRAAADGDVEAAVAYACRVGERAVSLLAYEEAARHYQQALDALHLRRGGAAPGDAETACRILLALGDAQWGGADLVAMRGTFLRAAEAARQLGPAGAPLLARAALGLGGRQQRAHVAYDDDVVRLLEEALAALDPADSALRARIKARLAYALYLVPEAATRRAGLSRAAVDMARRVGDAVTLRWVLNDWRWALWGPATSDQRMAVTNELLELAERLGDREMETVEHTWRLVDLMERADIVAVDAELARFRRLANELHLPWYRWYVGRFEAMQALLEGRFADAERFADEALAAAQRVQHRDAILIYSTLLLTLRMLQGRIQELEAGVQAFVANYPSVPIWQSVLAFVHTELGRYDQARAELARMALDDFRLLPRDYLLLPAAAYLSEVCSCLDDRGRAAELYEVLEPYGDRCVVVGFGVASLGAVARYLGLLAMTIRRWAPAAAHFEVAMEINQRMRAAPALAQSQYDYARLLHLAPDGELPSKSKFEPRELLASAKEVAARLEMKSLLAKIEAFEATLPAVAPRVAPHASGRASVRGRDGDTHRAVFRRQGDYWSLAFEGEPFQLQDLLGLRYIAHLLAHPGLEVHVTDLVHLGESRSDAERLAGRTDVSVRADLGDAGPMIDARAKADYQQRLRDLREELAEAEERHDAGRIDRLRTEMDALVEALAGAIGIGGRDRRAASHAERARVSVNKRIAIAIKRIAAHDADFARYLSTTLKTGSFCTYTPDPLRPVAWNLG